MKPFKINSERGLSEFGNSIQYYDSFIIVVQEYFLLNISQVNSVSCLIWH